jgi:hypothetical protein
MHLSEARRVTRVEYVYVMFFKENFFRTHRYPFSVIHLIYRYSQYGKD